MVYIDFMSFVGRKKKSAKKMAMTQEELDELMKKSRFVRISAASVGESHPHDIQITKEAPNYSAHLPFED